MTLFKLTAPDENGLQPTKWAKESSPGQSRGLDPCDALGQQISNDSPHVGVGSPPTPTRGENLGKYGLSTQGMAGGGARRHLAPRLLPFVRSARGYFPLALPAIFMKVTQDLFRSPRPMKMLEGPAPSGPRLRQVTAVTRATLHQNRIFIG